MNLDSIIHLLQGRGFRMTPIRRLFLETFRDSTQPISTYDLYTELTRQRLSCNRTTMYRELLFLEKQGVIKPVDFNDGVRRYEATADAHHHHFICTNCKTVFDVNLKHDLEIDEAEIEKMHGAKIASHSLEFFGLCKNCV
jgi:Fur family transcriptional regulator, ferric uptake regulator